MNLREKKKELTRAAILQSAIRLFREKGFANTSMDEIVEAATVSKGTLYNYFPEKEAIVAAYFQNAVSVYSDTIPLLLNKNQSVRDTLRDVLQFERQIFDESPELTAIYFQYRMRFFFADTIFDNPARSGLEPLLLRLMERGQTQEELRKDIPSILLARYFKILYMQEHLARIYENSLWNPEESVEKILDLFFKGAQVHED